MALVFAAPAAAVHRAQLALMPLPKGVLGPDAAGLVLTKDSGVDSNADAARHAGGNTTAATLSRAGRITGYTLDFASPDPGRRLLEVQTIAELYRSETTAAKGLGFWRGVTSRLNRTTGNGISTGAVPFTAHVGDGAFAFELTYRHAGEPVAYVGDVVFRTRTLLGAVFVTARDEAGIRARTVRLARALEARIRQVLAGKIR